MRTRAAVSTALWAMALACLSACMSGPDYRVPDDALVRSGLARGAFSAARDAAYTPADVPTNWWRLYDDPILDAQIAAALAANTDLRVAEAALQRSFAFLSEARALRQPTIPVEGGLQYGQVAGEQYLLRLRPPRSTDYEARVAIGYDLDLFGGIRRGIEAATADSEAVAAARDLVRVNVVAETARAYADICGAGLELVSARRSVELQRESLELTERLRNAGRAADLDVTRSRQVLEQFKSALPALESARHNALLRLTALTGRVPAESDLTLERCASPPRVRQAMPVGDGAALLRRRPDVRRAERSLAAATAGIGVAIAQLYPDIQLGISLGSLGANRDILTAPTNFWNIASLLQWQANQSAARARIDAARAAERLELASFDGVVLESLRQLESALSVYVHDLQRETLLQASRDEAARAAEDVRRLQSGGLATALEVVDAQRALAAAEQALAALQAALSDDQIAVFLALGGGWESD